MDEAVLKARRKQRKYEFRLRNHIEGKFGEDKHGYDLGLVKAKTTRTSGAWISAVFFVMNLARWLRDYFFLYFQSFYQLLFGSVLLLKKRFQVFAWI